MCIFHNAKHYNTKVGILSVSEGILYVISCLCVRLTNFIYLNDCSRVFSIFQWLAGWNFGGDSTILGGFPPNCEQTTL